MTEDTKNDFTEEVSEPCSEGAGVTLDDFVAYMPSHVYIFTPCREPWTQTSVNARLQPVPVLDKHGRPKRVKGKLVTVSASKWLDQNRPVEQMTWVPGFPMLIKNRLVVDGGWIERADVTCFNHYRAPRIVPGDASKAGPWLDHVHKIYPADAAHIIAWFGAPGAATAGEDQPRAGARRLAGHRKGHAARAGEARGRALEFPRRDPGKSVRPVQ